MSEREARVGSPCKARRPGGPNDRSGSSSPFRACVPPCPLCSDCYRIAALRQTSKRAKGRHRTGSLKSVNSAKIAHASECEGKSQKLTSHARLIKAIRDGVKNSPPENLANFRGPVSIGDKYHGDLPQASLSNHQQPHGGCVGGHEIPLLLYRIDLTIASQSRCRAPLYDSVGICSLNFSVPFVLPPASVVLLRPRAGVRVLFGDFSSVSLESNSLKYSTLRRAMALSSMAWARLKQLRNINE